MCWCLSIIEKIHNLQTDTHPRHSTTVPNTIYPYIFCFCLIIPFFLSPPPPPASLACTRVLIHTVTLIMVPVDALAACGAVKYSAVKSFSTSSDLLLAKDPPYPLRWAQSKCTSVFMWTARCSCQNLIELEFPRPVFEKSSNVKFHENPSSDSRVVPCG